MYCPIHNPSGGDYDPQKSQYKNRRHSMTNEYGRGSVTLISSEKVPIVQKPYTPPETFDADAAGVVQLDNTRKITTDFAAMTVTFGTEGKKTYVFNVKLLPSNSPARQVGTAIQYLTEERMYSRFERWVKQQRSGSAWYQAPAYGSIGLVRCHAEGRYHTPASPGPVATEYAWENNASSQAVTSQFIYMTGFKDKMASQFKDSVFTFVAEQVRVAAINQSLTLLEREAYLMDRIQRVNAEMFIDRRDNTLTANNVNDIIIHPLDLVGTTITWVGLNRVDDVFVTRDNTSDMRDWFMGHDEFHVPNKQLFVDAGYRPASFETDGSIYIKSNVRMMKENINEEKLYVEALSTDGAKYLDW